MFASHSTPVYTVQIIDGTILLVTLNRPKFLNSIASEYHAKLDQLWSQFEAEPRLRVAIITGKGKVFCAGADLIEWKAILAGTTERTPMPDSGFLGLSNRFNKKPIIAALNGSSYGGGTEALVNCDLAVACRRASISLPETRRGVIAIAGALPRIGRALGPKRAAELALVAEPISAETACKWGLLNQVVDLPEDVLPAAVSLAKRIVKGSPESIQASLLGIRRGYDETQKSLVESTREGIAKEGAQVMTMANVQEGLAAFASKRAPAWKPANL